ncbi:MAG TPA: STAS domain-containing protein [Telluria sp.]|nr:STAS domain-containing protein [Telluria sp.]
MLSLEALTFQTARAALEQGCAAISAGETVFDLGGVKTADSSGVALMLAWLRKAQAKGQRLTFINVPQNLDTIARLYGVDGLLAHS